MKKLFWVLVGIVFFICGCASAPKMPPKPRIEIPEFQLEVLQSPSIKTICYHQNISLPLEDISTQTRLLIEDLVKTSGFQVKSVEVGKTEEGCDADLIFVGTGKGIAATYTGGGVVMTCQTGIDLSVEFAISVAGIEQKRVNFSEEIEPSSTTTQSSCANNFSSYLENLWKGYLLNILESTWGPSSYYFFIKDIPATGSFVPLWNIPNDPALVPLWLNLILSDPTNTHEVYYMNLRTLGPDAEQATPYLLALLSSEYNNDNQVKNDCRVENIVETLEAITGEKFGQSRQNWWKWWASQ